MARLLETLLAAALVACSQSGGSSDAGTNTDAPPPAWCTQLDASTCQNPVPSYQTQIAPMLDRACNSTCHAPGVGPWPLTNYQDVFDWSASIQADIGGCTMPPPDAGAGNGNLSDTDRTTLLDWLACGAPNN